MVLCGELLFFFSEVMLKPQRSLSSDYMRVLFVLNIIFHFGLLLFRHTQTEFGLIFTSYIILLLHCWHMFLILMPLQYTYLLILYCDFFPHLLFSAVCATLLESYNSPLYFSISSYVDFFLLSFLVNSVHDIGLMQSKLFNICKSLRKVLDISI